jgi:hypothetical protein
LSAFAAALVLACGTGSASDPVAEVEPAPPKPGFTRIAQLQCLSIEELQGIFSAACGVSTPAGLGKGRVLVMANTKHPRMRTRTSNAIWKGKYFNEDGSFVNQWAGFRAISSHVAEGRSWFDGRPCIVLEYPPGTPVFGNARDEIRQVGPGLWLGMFYDREPCPKFRGFFALEDRPDRPQKGCR